MITPYDRLIDRFYRIAVVDELTETLLWDKDVMMPPRASSARGDQLAVLAGIRHRLLVDPEVANDLAAAEEAGEHDPLRATNLRLMRRAHSRASAVPADLVEAQQRAAVNCERIWREAKAARDFSVVRPSFTEVLNLTRQQAGFLGEALGLSPYDALLDGFQPGIGAADIAPVFDEYRRFLKTALPRAEEIQARCPAPVPLTGDASPTRLREFCERVAGQLGLDLTRARLDQSHHAFSAGRGDDVRITSRFARFQDSVYGVIHETGHAVYDQNLPKEFGRQPIGEHAGLAVHESQSLLFEMQVAMGDEFLRWLASELPLAIGNGQGGYDAANLASLLRRVQRGFIRLDADELTYPAHIVLRFELEQKLVTGELQVDDLPEAWGKSIHDLLDLDPREDTLGCLQDIHWFEGQIGYFPCYALGAMAAAQLMAAARRAEPGIDAAFGRGDFTPLLGWLHVNVHRIGNRLSFNELLRSATGKQLRSADFEAHLSARYFS